MKYLVFILCVTCFLACESKINKVDSNLTGRETTYTLYQGSDYNVSGTVTFKETNGQNTIISVKLNGTQKGLTHPTHLHFEDVSGSGNIAMVLNPIDGATGMSTTTLETLENSTKINYRELLKMEASVKVHLSDTGSDKNVILAGGNIGIAGSKKNPFGRMDITVCKSN